MVCVSIHVDSVDYCFAIFGICNGSFIELVHSRYFAISATVNSGRVHFWPQVIPFYGYRGVS